MGHRLFCLKFDKVHFAEHQQQHGRGGDQLHRRQDPRLQARGQETLFQTLQQSGQ